jgi:3-deoxy-D-manno-octulosonic-acid transferase
LAAYKTELGLGEKAYPVIVAGSTHPSEEEAVLTSFTALREKYPHARLIIAPRKPENRLNEIERLNTKFGYETGYRSKLKEMEGRRPEFPVLLIDTLGELGRIYAVGDIVFVGGSFVHYGGHNVLEPAAHAKPILVGPSMEDFKDSFSLLSRVGACRMVANADGLTEAFLEIAGDDALRKKMGDASLQVILENRGAANKTIRYLTDLLDLSATPRTRNKK